MRYPRPTGPAARPPSWPALLCFAGVCLSVGWLMAVWAVPRDEPINRLWFLRGELVGALALWLCGLGLVVLANAPSHCRGGSVVGGVGAALVAGVVLSSSLDES